MNKAANKTIHSHDLIIAIYADLKRTEIEYADAEAAAEHALEQIPHELRERVIYFGNGPFAPSFHNENEIIKFTGMTYLTDEETAGARAHREELLTKLKERNAIVDAAEKQYGVTALREKADRFYNKMHALDKQLMTTPAASLQGLLCQVNHISEDSDEANILKEGLEKILLPA